jgi:hypothetical protein
MGIASGKFDIRTGPLVKIVVIFPITDDHSFVLSEDLVDRCLIAASSVSQEYVAVAPWLS